MVTLLQRHAPCLNTRRFAHGTLSYKSSTDTSHMQRLSQGGYHTWPCPFISLHLHCLCGVGRCPRNRPWAILTTSTGETSPLPVVKGWRLNPHPPLPSVCQMHRGELDEGVQALGIPLPTPWGAQSWQHVGGEWARASALSAVHRPIRGTSRAVGAGSSPAFTLPDNKNGESNSRCSIHIQNAF